MAPTARDKEITHDRLLDAFLAASVVIVLAGWLFALAYLGFHFL
jgi:hypothetical protein